MHKTRITLPLFYLLTLCAPLFAAEPVAFVQQGKPVNVIQQPGPWKATGDGLVGEKMGQFLFGNVKLLEGDITVRLNMSIEQFDGTAAGLVLDGDNYIGFDSRNGSIFVQGPRFPSDSSIKIGNRDDLLRPGEPFEFVLERTNGTLNLYIDGKLLRQFDDPAKQFGTVGVRTHRAKIAVYNFSAEGNVEPLPDGFAFDRPSVAFVKPDLTSLKPVPGVETVVVFDSEVDGYNTYRIPAVIKTQAGTLLAFCEGRKNSRSDTGDIDLLVKRSDDDGRTWSTHTVIWDDGENTCGNPCPVIDRNTGDIILTMTRNPGSEHEREIQAGTATAGRTVWVCRSSDDGKTWSEPSNISEQTKAPDWRWYATGPGVGIQLAHGQHAGRLVIPCDHSVPVAQADGSEKVVNGSHAIYSDDGGYTWAYSEVIHPGCNECQAVELSDGRVMLNARSYEDPKLRRVSFSADGGETWTDPVVEEQLIEPRCQGSLILFDPADGGARPWVLFANPAHGFSRQNLVVRASADDGRTWPVARTIEPGYAAYSCLVQLDQNTVGCLYEGSKPGRPYQWIAFARFDWDWLHEQHNGSKE